MLGMGNPLGVPQTSSILGQIQSRNTSATVPPMVQLQILFTPSAFAAIPGGQSFLQPQRKPLIICIPDTMASSRLSSFDWEGCPSPVLWSKGATLQSIVLPVITARMEITRAKMARITKQPQQPNIDNNRRYISFRRL